MKSKNLLKTKKGKWGAVFLAVSLIFLIDALSGNTKSLIAFIFYAAICGALLYSSRNDAKNSGPKGVGAEPEIQAKSNDSELSKTHAAFTVSTSTKEYNVIDLIAPGCKIMPLDIGAGATQNPQDAPTERQIAYLQSYGVEVPNGACKMDISAMLTRLENGSHENEELIDSHTIKCYIVPESSPSIALARFASKMGFSFSRYIGAGACLNMLVHGLDSRDKAAFYAYAVYLSIQGGEFENMLDHPHIAEFYEFADAALQDESLMKSIQGRDAHDFKNPNRGTKAYKEAIKYLTN